MKSKLWALCALLLSVASVAAEQKFSSLPIGANLDGYINQILVEIGSRHTGNWTQERFEYAQSQDGTLAAFAERKLRDVAGRFTPVSGEEQLPFMWSIAAYTDGLGLFPAYNGTPSHIASAPREDEYIKLYEEGFYLTLRNGEWEVPEEVFGKVEFGWGWGVGYNIPGTRHLEVNLYAGTRVSRFSTLENISEEGNPCELPATKWALNVGDVPIPQEIATARSAWWTRAEITLLTEDGAFVTLLVDRTEQDGQPIRWSDPPPPFFTPPPPRIASLVRVGNTTEVTVEGSGSVSLEFSTDLREWQEGTGIVLQSTEPRVLRHQSLAPQGYYRLRQKEGWQD